MAHHDVRQKKMSKPPYTLSFVAGHKGQLAIHADSQGISVLISALDRLKRKIDSGACDHDHLHSDEWAGDELSETMGCEKDGHIVHHVKLYGWTEEWARKHGFRK
jgi:hypothetical protein